MRACEADRASGLQEHTMRGKRDVLYDPTRQQDPGRLESGPEEWPCDTRGDIEAIELRWTESYDRDLQNLTEAERDRVESTINVNSRLLIKDRAAAEKAFARPRRILLRGGLESSLCATKVGKNLSVLLTIDDDPVFGQVILTLLRVVRRGELKTAFEEVAKALYRDQRLEIETPET